MIIDMHSHSCFSHDSKAIIEETLGCALNKGLKGFAVTDHADIQYYKERNILNNIINSNKEAERLNKLYGDKIKVLKGVELGDSLFDIKSADELLKSSDFDVIILSVHDVRLGKIDTPFSEIDFSALTKSEIKDFLDKYFDDLLTSLNTFPCDIAAHLTIPLRYINGKYDLNIDSKIFEDKIIKILKFLIDNNIALEINAAGYKGGFIPERWVVEKYKNMGGYLVTIGSDSHVSENIGNGLENILPMLKEIGFKSYYYFEKRKPIEINL